jgi:hypothetical protein
MRYVIVCPLSGMIRMTVRNCASTGNQGSKYTLAFRGKFFIIEFSNGLFIWKSFKMLVVEISKKLKIP